MVINSCCLIYLVGNKVSVEASRQFAFHSFIVAIFVDDINVIEHIQSLIMFRTHCLIRFELFGHDTTRT